MLRAFKWTILSVFFVEAVLGLGPLLPAAPGPGFLSTSPDRRRNVFRPRQELRRIEGMEKSLSVVAYRRWEKRLFSGTADTAGVGPDKTSQWWHGAVSNQAHCLQEQSSRIKQIEGRQSGQLSEARPIARPYFALGRALCFETYLGRTLLWVPLGLTA